MVISGPSGVGKTTIARALETSIPGAQFSVSYTTRPASATDRDGIDYHFIDQREFLRMRDAGELLESAKVFDNWYGTGRQWVQARLATGALVILEIDVEGGKQIRAKLPQMLGLFVLPPSEDDLLQRLRARKREDESVIQRRFAEAKREIAEGLRCGAYDLFVVNRDLDVAVADVLSVVRGRLGLPTPAQPRSQATAKQREQAGTGSVAAD